MKMNKAFYVGLLLTVSGIITAAPAGAARVGDATFDLMNKSGKDITVLVNNGYKNVAKEVVKQATTLFGKTITPRSLSLLIDTNEPTLLVIIEGAYPDATIEPFRARGGDEFTPAFFYDWMIHGPKAKKYIYTFAKGKDIYVSLEANGNLRPQVGQGNKTATGYSKENEVSQSDIMRASEAYMGLD